MRNFYLVLGAAAAIVIGSAAACTTETETGEGGAGGTTTGTGTGTGTQTGTATGTGTQTGTATGSAACALCSEYATGTANSEDLCGYQGTDPDTGALLCDPGSSCEYLADLQACSCSGDQGSGTGCGDVCGDNACAGLDPTPACEDDCVYVLCVPQVTACVGDL